MSAPVYNGQGVSPFDTGDIFLFQRLISLKKLSHELGKFRLQ